MKHAKPKSTEPCSYCKVKATWKSNAITFIKFACDTHVPELKEHEKAYRDTGYMTEGDHQSWGRL